MFVLWWGGGVGEDAVETKMLIQNSLGKWTKVLNTSQFYLVP